jgi:hypothetical protein
MHGFLYFPPALLWILLAAHICVLMRCLLRVLQPEAGDPPLFATGTEGRPGKGLTLTLRLVPHPGVPRHLWTGSTKEPKSGAPPLFATATEGRPGKGLTLTLRLVSHPGVPRHLWAGPTKEPETGVPTLFATATEGRPGKGLTHNDDPSANTLGKTQQRFQQLTTIPVQTHLGRRSQSKHTWDATTCDALRQR